jgi:hypothetical protein
VQGPQIYQPKFGPTYRVSFSTSIGLLVCTVISVSTTWFFVRRGDQQRGADVDNQDVGSATPDSASQDATSDGLKEGNRDVKV